MKIDRPQVQRPVDAYKLQTPGGARAAQPEKVSAPSDIVALSAKGKEAAELRRKLRNVADVRTDLVEQIKAQVEAGTYNVDPKDVAEKLLRSKVLD